MVSQAPPEMEPEWIRIGRILLVLAIIGMVIYMFMEPNRGILEDSDDHVAEDEDYDTDSEEPEPTYRESRAPGGGLLGGRFQRKTYEKALGGKENYEDAVER